jgi:hypothetical protein
MRGKNVDVDRLGLSTYMSGGESSPLAFSTFDPAQSQTRRCLRGATACIDSRLLVAQAPAAPVTERRRT